MEILKIILKNKPTWIHSRDKHERLPLHYAAAIASYGGHVEVVKKFLEYCPNSTEMLDSVCAQNILHIAANYGKHEVVHYILQSQIDEYHKMINQQDNNGDTPLHLAARSCHPTVVYYLVNHKRVNLDLANKNNKTPLDIVSSFYKLDRSSLKKASTFIPSQIYHLTWTALKSAGAKQSTRTRRFLSLDIESKQSSNSPETVEESSSRQTETKQSNSPKNLFFSKGSSSDSTTYKDRVETLLLVSSSSWNSSHFIIFGFHEWSIHCYQSTYLVGQCVSFYGSEFCCACYFFVHAIFSSFTINKQALKVHFSPPLSLFSLTC
ncbi:hypothetical protein P8452_49108 [Trifolium repens]|nr:hypothetical protein P8452_49108 [Trifolium repens]